MAPSRAYFDAHRRQFIRSSVMATAGTLPSSLFGRSGAAKGATVRDGLWVFCCPVNSDYPNIHQRSVMTPAESTFFLGVPNILMVQVKPRAGEETWFKAFEPPFEQYAIALRPLKRVVWSVVGGGGVTNAQERDQVLAMARETPNFVGVYMDDFFQSKGGAKAASLSVDELRSLRQQLQEPDKKLDLFVTLYTNQLGLPITDYLELIDVVTLWTWKPADLVNLESNFTVLEKLAPKCRKMLGCYVVDYNERKSVPLRAMQHQCELGLRWLRAGRIEGIVILGNSVMDLGYEAVDWTRDWIAKVGDSRL